MTNFWSRGSFLALRDRGTRDALTLVMSEKVRFGFPFDETMRAEHGESIERPLPELYDDYDPADSADRGPHVDRVGLISVDTDFQPGDDAEADPLPRTTEWSW